MKFVSFRRVGVMALIAVVAVCVGGQAFAHIDGVGEEPGRYGVHLPHESLVGTIYDPAVGTWIDDTAHDLGDLMGSVHGNCSICHFQVWKHEMSAVASYASSATVGTTAPQPDGTSKKCLSCHDGTVSLNAFTGGPSEVDPVTGDLIGNAGTGTEPPMAPTSPGYLGTDLNHHHPVGIVYGDHLNTSQMVEIGTLNRYDVDPGTLLTDGRVECMTCHDPHTNYQANNPDNEAGAHSHVHEWGDFLKYNSLCFQCHQRYQEGVVGRAVSPFPQLKGHHFPGRDDPMGIARGNATGNAIACDYCHDIFDDGPHEPGDPHNTPCIECHNHWEETASSPATQQGYKGHHNLFAEAVVDAVEQCGVCHADPGSTELTGSTFGSTTTPACDKCHADVWSVDDPVVGLSATVDDVTGVVGQLVEMEAVVTNNSGTVTIVWDYGDNTPTQLPSTDMTTDHTYAEAGVYDAVAVVTDGEADPIAVEFTVTIDPVDAGDTWTIDDLDDGIDDYDITFGIPNVDGVFTSTDDSGNVGFGIEQDGTIFWIEMVFTADSWSVGDVYFGNIGGSTMSGIIITADGQIQSFSGSK